MLERARLVNKGQYAHGINSTSYGIEYTLKKIEEGKAGSYYTLNELSKMVMQLGGYLYALKEGI